MTLNLDAIKERADAATEGPWHWAGNTDSRQLYLATWKPGSGRCMVMDQSRWGMQGAKPQFVTDGLYVDGDEVAVYEVARNQGLPDDTPRSHPRVYRGDVVDINHPDAKFIAAARQDIPALIAEVERLQGIVDRVQALRDEMGEGKAFTILAMGKEADYPISYFLEYLDTALETE